MDAEGKVPLLSLICDDCRSRDEGVAPSCFPEGSAKGGRGEGTLHTNKCCRMTRNSHSGRRSVARDLSIDNDGNADQKKESDYMDDFVQDRPCEEH